MSGRLTTQSLGLKAGEYVEVRSRAEILSTLDKNGRLDELPFMPQMLQFCGQKVRVRSRAHKFCDTAHSTGGRSMSNAVILEVPRCDGEAFGKCEMRCQIFWKESWLKRADDSPSAAESVASGKGSGCSEADIWAATRKPSEKAGSAEPLYVCQATQMIHASRPLSPGAVGQYIEDYTSGNVPLRQILAAVFTKVYHNVAESGLGFGAAMRWVYNVFQKLRAGTPYPFLRGHLPKGSGTPAVKLNLQVGELVRVKGYDEILKTVDETLVNRGMSFHPEMVPYCGKTFRVFQRAGRFMNEKTGRIMDLKNECIVLEGADCIGKYTNPLYCPRDCYPYWREIWLERVGDAQQTAGERN